MFPFASVAYAQGVADQAANPLFQMLPFVLIFFIFYFLIIRPQQKKQKEHQVMLDELKKGDRVVTTGGIHGVVSKIGEGTVTLEIADKVRILVDRPQIGAMTREAKGKSEKAKNDKGGKTEKAEKADKEESTEKADA